ncbi:unnamed protein product [Calypogeia fissa]
MVLAVRRGIMLLISASSPIYSGTLNPSSSSLCLSYLRQHSSWERQLQRHNTVGFAGRRNVYSSALQQSSLWPVLGINRGCFISRRSFHDLPPAATYGEGLARFDEGFKQEVLRGAEKRLWWKRTPVLGFSGPSSWRERSQRLQRIRRLIVGYGQGNVWEPDRGGRGGEIFARALSSSAREAVQSAGDGPKTVKEINGGENGNHRALGRDQGRENLKDHTSNRLFGKLEGNGRSSQVNERTSPPSFKPRATFSEKYAPPRAEGGDGRSSGGNGRPPLEPKRNDSEKLAQFKGGASGRSLQAVGRPPYKPKANSYDKRAQSRGGERNSGSSQARGSQLPFKPKANHYDNLGSPSFNRLKAWYQKNMIEPAKEGTVKSPVKSSRDMNLENAQPRNETAGDGPQDGYKFREGDTELGQFRWTRDPQSRGSRGGDSHSKRVPFQERGPPGRPAGEGRNNRPVNSFRDRNAHSTQPRNESNGDGPHPGYKFREGGTEVGRFRRIGDPQNRGSRGGGSYGKRVPFQKSGATGRPAGEGRSNRPVNSFRDKNADNSRPRKKTDGGGPHSGYKSRAGGIELDQFRWIADPQDTDSGGGESHGTRVPFQDSGDLRQQTFPDSSRERNYLNSKQTSPQGKEDGDGPHYGYKFREGGRELGQFRPVGDSRGGGRHGKRVPFQNSGAPGQDTFPDSNSGRDTLDSKQTSPQEKKEEVVKKHPPRRLEGEKKWQYAVRKKQLRLAGHSRGSKKRVAPQWVDDENLGNEPKGDDWRLKKTAWLCKEIPALRPRAIVTILNEQRTWIKAEDTKYIIEHLLKIDQTLRAHRVLKWKMQQPWCEFDYELSSKVAVQLGQNNKLTRTKDIYDLIIQNGKVPNLATYEALIKCYVVDGEKPALAQAWSLYNQMSQLGGHEPPPSLSYSLFQGLSQKGLAFLDQADELFERIKLSGLACSSEMYSLLIQAHGSMGNNNRVDELTKEMKETGLIVGQDVYAATLKACAKDGNVAVGEKAFADLKENGHKPGPSVYSSLIKMYGKAGLFDKAFQTFEDMRETGKSPNFSVYEPIIEVAVLSGNRDQAEKLLKEAQERGTPSLHACYNSVMELYSKSGLLEESESFFNEMESKGYPPNQVSFNVLLEAFVEHQLVEKAEALYESLKQSGRVKPSKKTYELMIQLYGEAKNSQKLKELFKEVADKKLDVAGEAHKYLEAAVSQKQLEAHRNAQLKLEREEREILAGVLLAGAGVETHDKNRTYELHFGLDPDSEVGLALINHLYVQFAAWSTEPPQTRPLPDPRNHKKAKMLMAFQTVSHGSFRFFAHQYRPNHSPAIPRLIHRWLTPRALAYWYMYGGTKCPETGDILLNASAYSDKDIMLVVNALKARSIDCEKTKSSIGMAICFNGKSATWLWGLMEPHILPDLKGLLRPEDDKVESNTEQACD